MNFSLKKHAIDLIPIFTLGGIFKILILPNWDNMTYANPIVVNPLMTAWLVLGWSLVMAILYYWKKLHRTQENKKLLQFIDERIDLLWKKTKDETYTIEGKERAYASILELGKIRDMIDLPKKKFWRFTK